MVPERQVLVLLRYYESTGSVMGRLKQVKFYLGEEQYEKLRRIAEQQGLSVPALVKSIVLEYLGEAEYGDLVHRIEELERKYEQLAREVGRIERDLALLVRRCSKS